MLVHQFVHTLTTGDAISGEALAIQRLLREVGVAGEIYCVNVHPNLAGGAKLMDQFLDQPEQMVILHYSIASPLNGLYLSLAKSKRALIYHNLTPTEWFRSYNPRVTDDLQRAHDALKEVLQGSEILLGDSTFNCQEMTALLGDSGVRSAPKVLPLLIDQQKWSVPANSGISALLRSHGGRNLLTVGRIAPNKCFEDVLKCFYFYHHKIDPKSKLWIVGSDVDTEIYSFELRELTRQLRLESAVTFTGAVADTELKAFYQGADIYLSMSEHEGFCVPIIEAMYFGVPLIAFDAGAVRETVGEGGVVVSRKSHAEIAELIDYVLSEPQRAQRLREQGWEQCAKFNEQSFKQNLQRTLLSELRNGSEDFASGVTLLTQAQG